MDYSLVGVVISLVSHTHINRIPGGAIMAFLNLISPFLELVRELYRLSGTGNDLTDDNDLEVKQYSCVTKQLHSSLSQ